MNNLITPHGGDLCDLMVSDSLRVKIQEESIDYSSITLNDRQLCDLEMLLNGAYSPLKGFLIKEDYDSVLDGMRLANGIIWPIPITLDISEDFSKTIDIGEKIVLRDPEGVALAVLTISDKWTPRLEEESKKVFGSSDALHPAVDYLLNQSGPLYIGGNVEGLEYPRHYDYQYLRHTPSNLRSRFETTV